MKFDKLQVLSTVGLIFAYGFKLYADMKANNKTFNTVSEIITKVNEDKES